MTHPPHPKAPAWPIHERDESIAAVTTLARRASAGRGGALFLLGGPGLGKTTVLEAAAARVANTELTRVVLVGGGTLASPVPYGLMDQIERALVDRSAPAGPSLMRTLADSSVGAEDGLLTWLGDHAPSPTLLLVDDLHWCDRASLDLLLFASRRLEHLPIALVATLRRSPPEAIDACRVVLSSSPSELIELEPLSASATAALVHDRLGVRLSVSDGTAEDAVGGSAWRQTGGNPLLAVIAADQEVARRLDDPPSRRPGEDRAFLRRFTGLDDGGLPALGAVAVLGEDLDAAAVAEVAAVSREVAEGVLDHLFDAGLTEESDGSLRLTHPLLGRVVQDDLAPPVRRRLHARAFVVRAAQGQADRAERHAEAGDLVGQTLAADVVEQAGRRAVASGDLDEGARQLDLAVRLHADAAPTGLRLLSATGLVERARLHEAVIRLQAVLRDPALPAANRADALTSLGHILCLLGLPHRGRAVAEDAWALGDRIEPAPRVAALLVAALARWIAEGPAPAADPAREACAVAASNSLTGLRDRARWVRTLLDAETATDVGGTPACDELADPVDLMVQDLAQPLAPLYCKVRVDTYAGRLVEAEATLELARPAFRRAADGGRATYAVHEAWLALRTGDLRRASEAAGVALHLAGDLPLVARRAHLAIAEALTWAGQADEADRHLVAAEPGIHDDVSAAIWRTHLVGLRLLHAGDPTASERFEAIEQTSAAAGIGEPCHHLWADHAVRAHLAADRPDRAQRLVGWLGDRARELPCPWPGIAADLGRARIAERSGDGSSADEAYRQALARHTDAGLPLQRAEALTSYGAFLRRRGRSADAREALVLAESLAERCGATALEQAARAELVVSDRRGGPVGLSLTSGERRVAELASQGRTNAAIARMLGLSVNTVETHLKHTYAKLGISSRRALRQVL